MTEVVVTADDLARMLVGVGPASGPLHSRLSTGLAELVDRGELAPLSRLPSERALAAVLTLSRTTVVTAYQRLQESGRVERRQGSGTRVRAGRGRDPVSGPMLTGDHAAAQFLDGPLATIDFATAPLPALDRVAEVAAGISREDYLQLIRTLHGYHLRGAPALRERIARWYRDNDIPTEAEQILITSGAQQALELIARGCLRPGDRVITESPTYRGALDTFSRVGARAVPLAVGDDGLDVDALGRLVTAEEPRLVYVQAGAHNPTGAVLEEGGRRALLRLVERGQALVVDDTSLASTVFDGPVPAPALGSHRHLITIGSFSKLFWSGLRIGWVRADAQTVSRLALLRGVTDMGTSMISQEIAVRLFDDVEHAQTIRRAELPTGLRRLQDLLGTHLPDWTWRPPRAGGSLWVQLPHGDATHFAQVALRYGVALLPGAVFSPDGSGDDHTRLPYGLPTSLLQSGVVRLAQAWRAHVEQGLGDTSVTAQVT